MTFEWKAGALFAIPLNCWHQHFNGSGRDPARFVSVTNAPIVINLYEDLDFIFGTKYDFKGRFNGEPDYFSAKDETKGFLLATNFVPDAVNLPLITAKERGAGGGHIRFNFAKSSLNSHISQFPIGTYKKAHAHGPGAHVIILSGEGYSLMWPEGDEPRYYKWEVGTMIVPPNMWLHQHFNTGTTPARYLAFKHEGVAIRNAQGVPKAWISKRLGGDQIDYADENPETRKEFEQELAKHGLKSQMDKAYAAEIEWTQGRQDARRGGEGTCMTFPAQTHWHEPTGGKRAGFGKFGRPKTPYDNFMESEGIPVFRDIGVSKVQNLPLAPWKRTGGRGSYIQLHGTEGKWGCYVIEVPGAGALNPEKHIYEEIYFVVEGRGTTEVWLDDDNKRHVFEWQKGSLFSIPVNAMHRIVNASSSPALLLAGTTAPNLMNLINNVGAIFDNPYQFRDRFSGADDFYKYKDDIEPDPVRGLAMRRTNFVPDIVNCDLPLDNRRSPGFRRVEPFMTGNTFYLWIGQHENGRYSKAHAHTSAAVLDLHQGQGLHLHLAGAAAASIRGRTAIRTRSSASTTSRSAWSRPRPAARAGIHQHFGASKEPLRLTAWFGPHNPGREPGPPGEQHIDYTAMDIPEGGSAIPYWMEDPYIKKEYDERLRPRRRREPHAAGVLRQELQGRTAEGISAAPSRRTRLPKRAADSINQPTNREELPHACRRARRAFHRPCRGFQIRQARRDRQARPLQGAQGRAGQGEPDGAAARVRREALQVDGRRRHHRAGAVEQRPRPRSGARPGRRRAGARGQRLSRRRRHQASEALRGLRRAADGEPRTPAPPNSSAP